MNSELRRMCSVVEDRLTIGLTVEVGGPIFKPETSRNATVLTEEMELLQ
jgi:hypothetical protein